MRIYHATRQPDNVGVFNNAYSTPCLYLISQVVYIAVCHSFERIAGDRTTRTSTVYTCIVQCFTSPPTQYRLYRRRFLQVKRPNQQYQSTEGESCKGKQHKKQRKHKLHMHTHTK